MSTFADEWLAAYGRAWETKDAAAAASLFTDDALYREQPYDPPLRGAAGVRDYWTRVTPAQNDIRFRTGEVLERDGSAAAEWWVTFATDEGSVTLAGSFFLRFADDGRCRELREYWHVGEGARTPPDGWGELTS